MSLDRFLELSIGEDCAGVVTQFCVNRVLLRRAFGVLKNVRIFNHNVIDETELNLERYPDILKDYLLIDYDLLGKPAIDSILEFHNIFKWESMYIPGLSVSVPRLSVLNHESDWNTIFCMLNMPRPQYSDDMYRKFWKKKLLERRY